MDFFNNYNNGAVTNQPKYFKNTELPLFIPLKMTGIAPVVTALGPTHQVNAIYDGYEVFFFLNGADHRRVLEYGGCTPLTNAITAQEPPFVFAIRRRTGLSSLFVPHTVEMMTKFQSKIRVNLSDIPIAVQAEIDFPALAASGITLNP